MIAQLFDMACNLSPNVRRFLIKHWFQYLSVLDKEALMVFMNLGYAPTHTDKEQSPALAGRDEINRYCIQMYHHVAGAVELNNCDVLEVGSGRGGGASYITRYLRPRSMTGLDISENAVAFCNTYHQVEKLHFLQGDAEALPFADNSFDVVVNIESSYGYGHVDTFLSEVRRVLRPGGYFLFTDYRARDAIDTLQKQLCDSGLTKIREECITMNVLKALNLDNERKQKLIQQRVPAMLQKIFHYFAAMQGSHMYKALNSGAIDYRFFVLVKNK
ncbi:class I SAM-dependent methyltransferase [Dictyobacter kobayashii]|uniref:Fatty-acid O-methyltransferase n=1 Tax=Dictyobacter kobayashii TaxID=2014872 RepID=A0A402ARB5_9CHLR|nr:class I SAM-dependent methyltransferase [Dictyobacter kobayashii]GCE21629.1 fatty-acid O-methyltransferase [Dictyobacter kobayashii]